MTEPEDFSNPIWIDREALMNFADEQGIAVSKATGIFSQALEWLLDKSVGEACIRGPRDNLEIQIGPILTYIGELKRTRDRSGQFDQQSRHFLRKLYRAERSKVLYALRCRIPELSDRFGVPGEDVAEALGITSRKLTFYRKRGPAKQSTSYDEALEVLLELADGLAADIDDLQVGFVLCARNLRCNRKRPIDLLRERRYDELRAVFLSRNDAKIGEVSSS